MILSACINHPNQQERGLSNRIPDCPSRAKHRVHTALSQKPLQKNGSMNGSGRGYVKMQLKFEMEKIDLVRVRLSHDLSVGKGCSIPNIHEIRFFTQPRPGAAFHPHEESNLVKHLIPGTYSIRFSQVLIQIELMCALLFIAGHNHF